ncbi:hypothetical protein [Microbacterium sp.]|uniref:hypothetical protein n=1 Tax=Microbacterium sp. TaxID=51671 RepID=UPI003919176D
MGLNEIPLDRRQQIAIANAIGVDVSYVEDNGVQLYQTDDPDRVSLRISLVGTLSASRLADAL